MVFIRSVAPIESIRHDGAHEFIVDFNSFDKDEPFKQLLATLFEAGYNPHVGDLVVNSPKQRGPLLYQQMEENDEEAEHPPYIITPEGLEKLIDLHTDEYKFPSYFSPFVYPLDYWKYPFQDLTANLQINYADLSERAVLSAVVRYKFIHTGLDQLSPNDIQQIREDFILFSEDSRDITDYVESLDDRQFVEYLRLFTELEKSFRYHLAQIDYQDELLIAHERAVRRGGEEAGQQAYEQIAISRDLIGFYYTVEGLRTMENKPLPLIFFVDEKYYFKILKPFMEGYFIYDNQIEIKEQYLEITKQTITELNRKLSEILQNMCVNNLGANYAYIDSTAYNPEFPEDEFMPEDQLEILDAFKQFLKLKEELGQ